MLGKEAAWRTAHRRQVRRQRWLTHRGRARRLRVQEDARQAVLWREPRLSVLMGEAVAFDEELALARRR